MDKIRRFFTTAYKAFQKIAKCSDEEITNSDRFRPAFVIELPGRAAIRGRLLPRWASLWGLAYRCFSRDVAVLLPIPINLLVGVSRNLYFRTRNGLNPSWIEDRYRKKYPDYDLGYREGQFSMQVRVDELTSALNNVRKSYLTGRQAWLLEHPGGTHAIRMRGGKDVQEICELLNVEFLPPDELTNALAKVDVVRIISEKKGS